MIAGGYDAALYGVVYALAIRDDLLSAFETGGWLSPVVGRRYVDEVLTPGAFVPPARRLEALLGRPTSSRAFVARLGRAVEAARAVSERTGAGPEAQASS
jgi:Zn-dependent oligopeptidase